MATGSTAPTGLARRARRLSDRETERRMLAAAVAMVNRAGLTVSLDHLSFEDIIREAGVSRSAVYRHWPYKDLFFSDLVIELASDATPPIVADELALIGQVLAQHQDWLETPELRHSLIIELCRQLALFDFQAVYGSAAWRTYLALHATFLSLVDGELRDRVQEALADSERRRARQIASSWRQLTSLFGYRLRPELGVGYEDVAKLLTASLRGLVIQALSDPGLAERRVPARPFGAATEEEWSLPALGLASIAAACLEPDPAVEWAEQRLARVRQELAHLELTGP
jgi:AcrR family transcriptional regulator